MASKHKIVTPEDWTPNSWKTKQDSYKIIYRDFQATENTLDKLGRLPSLVSQTEVSDLKRKLKEVALGKAFVWQGGDCAELFAYCEDGLIKARLSLLSQLGLIFSQMTQIPTILLGRIAGQYGKPRNGLTEMIRGAEVRKFYGDSINSSEPQKREPDPARMLLAYFHSSSTLNCIRTTLGSEKGNWCQNLDWSLGPLTDQTTESMYNNVLAGINNAQSDSKTRPFVYTTHEGLFLHYENAFTKPWDDENVLHASIAQGTSQRRWFNSSAHFIWIGDKTRQINGAHVEYFRGLENPIGIKIGPSMRVDDIVKLLDVVNPDREIGKVTLITRLGEHCVLDMLHGLIKAVQSSGHVVIWQCDPLHGNTEMTSAGFRTRRFSSVLGELMATIDAHQACNSFLGGIHLEMTPDDVVECVGGSEGWTEGDLGPRYDTKCDPRLNQKQALELAFQAGRRYQTAMGETFRSIVK